VDGVAARAHPDAPTFFGAALVLASLALVGSLVRAWHATHIDPLVALCVE